MSKHHSIQQLIAVAEKLQQLREQVVFVGGAATVLLIDDLEFNNARHTEDVDFIVDIATYPAYARFESSMRTLGFRNDTSEGAPICRWLMDFMGTALRVDTVPADPSILGFANRWYPTAMATAWRKELKPGLTIKVVAPVYFLGTKFEAFKGRGKNDIFSHDLEDIVYVLEHRSDIVSLIHSADETLKAYLASEFTQLLLHPALDNSLPGIVDDQASVDLVLEKMRLAADMTD